VLASLAGGILGCWLATNLTSLILVPVVAQSVRLVAHLPLLPFDYWRNLKAILQMPANWWSVVFVGTLVAVAVFESSELRLKARQVCAVFGVAYVVYFTLDAWVSHAFPFIMPSAVPIGTSGVFVEIIGFALRGVLVLAIASISSYLGICGVNRWSN